MFSKVVVSMNSHGTGVLEMRKGHTEQARAFFQTAASLGPGMFEAHYNFARYQYIPHRVIYKIFLHKNTSWTAKLFSYFLLNFEFHFISDPVFCGTTIFSARLTKFG
jgi:hypothetical protein